MGTLNTIDPAAGMLILAAALACAVGAWALMRRSASEAGIATADPAAEQAVTEEEKPANPLVKLGTALAGVSEAFSLAVPESLRLSGAGDLAAAGLEGVSEATWGGLRVAAIAGGLLVGGAAMAALGGPGGTALLFACAAAGFLGPGLILKSKVKERAAKLDAQAANVLEELSIAVRSGYSLERGIKLVGEEMHGELAGEFARLDREMNLAGLDFEQAMGRMAERCDTPVVSQFTASLIQARRQGTSIARVLQAQAESARRERNTQLSVEINKLSGKLVAPIFGIMGLIILISLVPPIYNTVQVFTGAAGSAGGISL